MTRKRYKSNKKIQEHNNSKSIQNTFREAKEQQIFWHSSEQKTQCEHMPELSLTELQQKKLHSQEKRQLKERY